jgi:hypothetical protein
MTSSVHDDVNLLSVHDFERLSKKQTDSIKRCYYNALKHLSEAMRKKTRLIQQFGRILRMS